eukprot:1341699-Pleurochrysis_carterae.AAC.2
MGGSLQELAGSKPNGSTQLTATNGKYWCLFGVNSSRQFLPAHAARRCWLALVASCYAPALAWTGPGHHQRQKGRARECALSSIMIARDYARRAWPTS